VTEQRQEALPADALAVVGGPLGRHASARALSWAATVLPLLAATVGMMALSVVQRSHCIQKGWTGSDQFWHGCFSDLPALYQLGNLHEGLAAYLGDTGARSDHPALTGALMALVGGVVPDGSLLDQTRWYFALWAVLATACAVGITWLTAATRPQHAALAAQVALSPVLPLTALISADIFGVLLVSAGLWAWARRRPVAAGVFLGLAVAARTYPLLVLLALAVLALRTGRTAALRRTLLAAAGALAVVALPFLVGNPSALWRTYQVWWDSSAGLGSPWMVPQHVGFDPLPSGLVTMLTVATTVLVILVTAVFALGTDRRPGVAEVSLVLVGLCLVVGKAFPVQASLWLVPLVALCGLRWRDHLVWAGAEALHFAMVWLYVGGLSKPDRGLPAGWYAVFLLLRVAAVVHLVVRVWRQAAARPPVDDAAYAAELGEGDEEAEVPAAPETDDLAGDFADAPDQLLVRLT
jgi:uncharacterized membrane protein